jgi:hypothetical protein
VAQPQVAVPVLQQAGSVAQPQVAVPVLLQPQVADPVLLQPQVAVPVLLQPQVAVPVLLQPHVAVPVLLQQTVLVVQPDEVVMASSPSNDPITPIPPPRIKKEIKQETIEINDDMVIDTGVRRSQRVRDFDFSVIQNTIKNIYNQLKDMPEEHQDVIIKSVMGSIASRRYY